MLLDQVAMFNSTNMFRATLLSPVGSSDVVVRINAEKAAFAPDAPFPICIGMGTGRDLMLVTQINKTTGVLTVNRSYFGVTPIGHLSGEEVKIPIVSEHVGQVQENIKRMYLDSQHYLGAFLLMTNPSLESRILHPVGEETSDFLKVEGEGTSILVSPGAAFVGGRVFSMLDSLVLGIGSYLPTGSNKRKLLVYIDNSREIKILAGLSGGDPQDPNDASLPAHIKLALVTLTVTEIENTEDLR
jgi:hypothetical protein